MFSNDELLSIPDDLREETKNLCDYYFNNEVKENSIDEYIQNHGSERLKIWEKESLALYKKNLKKGIIYN